MSLNSDQPKKSKKSKKRDKYKSHGQQGFFVSCKMFSNYTFVAIRIKLRKCNLNLCSINEN